MQTQPKGPAHQGLRVFANIELQQPASATFSTIQQQWRGAREHLHSHFSNCITQFHQKIRGPHRHPGLELLLIKHGGEDWQTHLKKALETVALQVDNTLKAGKEKFTKGFGNKMSASSLGSSRTEPRHQFDMAMGSEEVSKRLDGIPVYTVRNANNEFVLVSDMNKQKSLGLFCFRQQDAEAILSQVRGKEPGLDNGLKVVAVSLNKVYELQNKGATFRFLPDPHQVKNALEEASKAGIPGQSFPGVPVFQSNNLVIRSTTKQFQPLFFSKEDLESSLRHAYEEQKKLYPSLDTRTDIQVGSFEDVIQSMETSEDSSVWEDIVFIPPGFNVFNQITKTTSTQIPGNGSAFG